MNAIPKQLTFFAALYIGMVAQPQAALVVPVGNPLVVNDTDLNVVWTQDANLFKTLAASNPDLVKQIISTTPTVTDS